MLVSKLCKPILKFVHVLQKLLCQNCIDHKLYNERRVNFQNAAKKKVESAVERSKSDSIGYHTNRRLIRKQNKECPIFLIEKNDLNASSRPPVGHRTLKPMEYKKKCYRKVFKTIPEHSPKKISREVQTGVISREDRTGKKILTSSTIKKKREYKKRKKNTESKSKNTSPAIVNKRHKLNKRERKSFIDNLKLKRIRPRNYKKSFDPLEYGLKTKAINFSPDFVFNQICMIIDIVMPHFVLSAVEESFAKTDLEHNEVRNYVNDYIHDAKKGFKEMIFYYLCNSQEDVWRKKLNQMWHCLEMCKFYILGSDGAKKSDGKKYVKAKTRSAPKKKKKIYKFISKANFIKPCLPLQESGRSNSDITMEKVSSLVHKECRADAKIMCVEPKTK